MSTHMTDEELAATDFVADQRGKAVAISIHERFPEDVALRIMQATLDEFGQDGRVKVPKEGQSIGRTRLRRPFFVIATSVDPFKLREIANRVAAEQLSSDPENGEQP